MWFLILLMRDICRLFPICLFFVVTLATSVIAQKPPVDVPDINGMALTLVQPAFPQTALDVGADGSTLTVRVNVDESGSPTSAVCSLTCNEMLKDAAELAAMTSTYRPLIKKGRAVQYQGILIYHFAVNTIDWLKFSTAIESTRQFDNISLGPVANILTPEFEKEKKSLLSLDAEGVDFDTRQKVIAEVFMTLRSRLKGMDLWRFDLGSSLRRVTFWTQAGAAIDRNDLQASLANLSAITTSHPEGVSDELITALTAMSMYKVTAEISENDLRAAIREMSRTIYQYLK